MNNPSTDKPIVIELCIASLGDALLCAEHGVKRIELNSALELGGLTPSIGLTQLVVQALRPTGCGVIAMVRPRPGGFAYTTADLRVMQHDIDRLLAVGVDGIAFGVLSQGGEIAIDETRALIEPALSAGREAVFHRAFDLTPRPAQALDTLIELGFSRVLTSGGAVSAIQGASVIQSLIKQANGAIQVLPGGGIKPHNVAELIRTTGCDQVHASLRTTLPDASVRADTVVKFNSEPPPDSAYSATDQESVLAMMRAIRG